MSESITVTLPMPPRVLTPNGRPFSRGGMIGKAVASKKQRLLASAAVHEMQLDSIPWPRVECEYVFFHPTKRRRDDDNYIASMKAARDGIVQAGLVLDDCHEQWLTKGARFAIGDPKRVEIILTRKEIES